nr:alpha/beta hydrolase [Clostridia bacterium]
MKKVLKVIGIIILLLGVLIAVLFHFISKSPSVPENYTDTVKTGGEIEAKYLAMGSYEVEHLESATVSSLEKFEVYYPIDIYNLGKVPVVIFLNGTGTPASKYPALQEHLASWGFITIANEENNSFYGEGVELSIRYLLFADTYSSNDDESPLKGHIDFDNIGVTGHSQGGIGVINGITIHPHSDMIKAAVMLSSTETDMAKAFLWDSDSSLIHANTMMIGSSGQTDSAISPLESMQKTYENITDDVIKVLARRNDCDHGEMLYYADGYVTAWFMYFLQGDEEAGKAFFGDNPEISANEFYQDIMINVTE